MIIMVRPAHAEEVYWFAGFRPRHGIAIDLLTFLAGMVGFCLTGDIFDLFVWFQLMGVSAYALTAYRPEERGPVQGALNFAITNSIGAYLSLSGVGV